MEILKKKYGKPIEREYESWILSCIEDYFKLIGKKIIIWAVSPMTEKTYPADEIISYDSKLIGLQFKNVSVSGLRNNQQETDFSNIFWELNTPTTQFPLIQKKSEIFYCLPTFINRDFKKISLNHCIFWRPTTHNISTSYWYDNSNVTNNNGKLNQEGIRWGKFVEDLFKCHIGKKMKSNEFNISLIAESFLTNSDISTEGLYALIVEL